MKTLRAVFIFFLAFFSFSAYAAEEIPAMQGAKQKICLNMIVKDESQVIKRCLDSVKLVIDYWVIVDTGSKDGTQKIIKEQLKGIPGELHERPWRNFEANRNEALELAKGKGDYILFMDADDVLEFEGNPKFPTLSKDLYTMWRGTKDFSYIKSQLVKGNLPWKWVGVTHEYLDCEHYYTSELLETVKYVTTTEGASAKDPRKKFMRNVELLQDGMKKEPNNSRYAFYLAESYRDAGEKAKALEWYQKRIAMGGWDEEIFWAKYQSAQMLSEIGMSPNIVIEAYFQAHQFRPHRAEPIYHAVEVLLQEKNYVQAYGLLKMRDSVAKPLRKDSLFNSDWIENYGLLFQLSICSYYVGNYQESSDACDKLLAMKDLPYTWRDQTKINRDFAVAKLQTKAEEIAVALQPVAAPEVSMAKKEKKSLWKRLF